MGHLICVKGRDMKSVTELMKTLIFNTHIQSHFRLIKLIFFLIISITPVYAQESNDLVAINNTETLSVEPISEISTQTSDTIEWMTGIFAIIGGAITFLGVLLTVRFVYINHEFEKRQQKIYDSKIVKLSEQERLFKENNFSLDDLHTFTYEISSLEASFQEILRFRKDNAHYGVRIDILCMSVLLIIGISATFSIFSESYIILATLVAMTIFSSIIHFAIQIQRMGFRDRINQI